MKLASGVALLVLIDLLILLIYTIVEGLRGRLNAVLVQNEENPLTEIGVSVIRCGQFNKILINTVVYLKQNMINLNNKLWQIEVTCIYTY